MCSTLLLKEIFVHLTSFRSLCMSRSFNCYFSSIISPWTPQRFYQCKIFLKQYTLVYYFFISNDEDFVTYLLLQFYESLLPFTFQSWIYNPIFVFNLWRQSTLHSGTFFNPFPTRNFFVSNSAQNQDNWSRRQLKQLLLLHLLLLT